MCSAERGVGKNLFGTYHIFIEAPAEKKEAKCDVGGRRRWNKVSLLFSAKQQQAEKKLMI